MSPRRAVPAAAPVAVPGGEPFGDFHRRVTDGLDALLAETCGAVPWAYERMPLGYGGCATVQTRDLSLA